MDTKAGIMHKVSRMSHGDLMRKKAELLQQKRALRESGHQGKKEQCCVIAIKGGYKNLEVSVPMKVTELVKYVGRNFSRSDFAHENKSYVLYYDSNAQVRNKLAKKLFNRWFVGNVVILGADKDTVMSWKTVDLESSNGTVESNTILEQGEILTSGVTIEDCSSEENPCSDCSSEYCSAPSISELIENTGNSSSELVSSSSNDVPGEESTFCNGPKEGKGDRGM